MHQLHIELTGVVKSPGDRLLGDLVEHHPLDRHLGGQQLQEMPTDAFAFPVFVSRQQELVHPLEGILQLANDFFLVLRDHVERLKVSLCVDAKIGPLLPLVRRRDLARIVGQVAHVAHRGLHPVSLGEETTDGAGLRGALDDDQGVRHRREVTVPFFIAPSLQVGRMAQISNVETGQSGSAATVTRTGLIPRALCPSWVHCFFPPRSRRRQAIC